MSLENVEIARRAVAAAFKRPRPDFDVMNELYHPDHVFVPFEAEGLGGDEVHGARGYREWLNDETVRWIGELDGAVDVGTDLVLVSATNEFQGSASGIQVTQRVWCVLTVKSGQVTRSEAFIRPEQAVEAVAARNSRPPTG